MIPPICLPSHGLRAARLIPTAIFAGLLAPAIFAQTKPERQSKGAKAAQTAQASVPTPSSGTTFEEGESAKPEDKAFKGMKYRMIDRRRRLEID